MTVIVLVGRGTTGTPLSAGRVVAWPKGRPDQVPAWTAEDLRKLHERVARAQRR